MSKKQYTLLRIERILSWELELASECLSFTREFLEARSWVGPESGCRHEWQATTLLTSVVHDCKLCGLKKESL